MTGVTEETIQAIQQEAGEMAERLDSFMSRLLELLALLPGDEEYSTEVHEGRVCPSVEFVLYSRLEEAVKEGLREAEAALRDAASLTDAGIRRARERTRATWRA